MYSSTSRKGKPAPRLLLLRRSPPEDIAHSDGVNKADLRMWDPGMAPKEIWVRQCRNSHKMSGATQSLRIYWCKTLFPTAKRVLHPDIDLRTHELNEINTAAWDSRFTCHCRSLTRRTREQPDMAFNAFYETLRQYCEIFTLQDFEFEGGGFLPELQLAVRTFGTLNDNKDNAILVTTWYGGTGAEMEANYVGRTHAINPEKYFVVIIDQIGSGLSSSPHNTLPPNNMTNFPVVCIGDDVKAQKKLLEQEWGITKLVLVFGGSMGGMQAYEWAVQFPDAVQRVGVLSSVARTPAYSRMLPEYLERVITIDGGWNGGNYLDGAEVQDGLELHAKVLAGTGFSPAFYRKQRYSDTPPRMQYENQEVFVQEYWVNFVGGMDPNALICMLRKWRNANVARNFESLKQALGTVTAKVLVMPIEKDEFFILEDQEAEQQLIANSCLRPIHTEFGHCAMHGCEKEFVRKVDGHLAHLLNDKLPPTRQRTSVLWYTLSTLISKFSRR